MPLMIALVLLSSCTKSETKEINLAEVKTAIAQGNAKYIQAYEKGSAAMYADLFIDDGMMVYPNVEPIRGKEHIQAEVERLMTRSSFLDWELNSLSFSASGTQACELLQYGFTLHPEGKNPIALSGKYLMVWKQQSDGIWKIQLLMAQPND